MSPIASHETHLTFGLPRSVVHNPLHDLLPSADDARDILHGLGVQWDHLTEATAHGADLVGLLCVLDQLGAVCGRAGLHWFLTRPCPTLHWRAPGEVLATQCGAAQVIAAVQRELHLHHHY